MESWIESALSGALFYMISSLGWEKYLVKFSFKSVYFAGFGRALKNVKNLPLLAPLKFASENDSMHSFHCQKKIKQMHVFKICIFHRYSSSQSCTTCSPDWRDGGTPITIPLQCLAGVSPPSVRAPTSMPAWIGEDGTWNSWPTIHYPRNAEIIAKRWRDTSSLGKILPGMQFRINRLWYSWMFDARERRKSYFCRFSVQSHTKAGKVTRFDWKLRQTLLLTLGWSHAKMRRLYQKLKNCGFYCFLW